MKKIIALTCLLVIWIAGCSPAATTTQPSQPQAAAKQEAASQTKPMMAALNRDLLKNYASTFKVQFDGAKSWKYQLTTRKTAKLREENLHIEGVEKANNPGDVRLVTDGTTTWMIGPGTDQECVRFPNGQGLDPSMLYPETLIREKDLTSLVGYVGEKTTAGLKSLHYNGKALNAGGWNNLNLDVYQEVASGALLQFAMQATGEDPVFGAGSGSLTAQYTVSSFDAPSIEPVKGCEINAPLPDSAKNLVRLPGMASFESPSGIDEINQYYQAQLPGAGWIEAEPPEQSEGSVVLSYRREAQEVEIHIEAAASGGSKVKLLFVQAQ